MGVLAAKQKGEICGPIGGFIRAFYGKNAEAGNALVDKKIFLVGVNVGASSLP